MHKKLSNLLKVNITILFVLIVKLDFTEIKILGMSQDFIKDKCMLPVLLVVVYIYLIIRAMHEYYVKKEDSEFIEKTIFADVKERLVKKIIPFIESKKKSSETQSFELSTLSSSPEDNLKIRDFMSKVNRTIEYNLDSSTVKGMKGTYPFSWLTMLWLIIKSRWESLKSSSTVFDYYLTTLTTIISVIWVVIKIVTATKSSITIGICDMFFR